MNDGLYGMLYLKYTIIDSLQLGDVLIERENTSRQNQGIRSLRPILQRDNLNRLQLEKFDINIRTWIARRFVRPEFELGLSLCTCYGYISMNRI